MMENQSLLATNDPVVQSFFKSLEETRIVRLIILFAVLSFFYARHETLVSLLTKWLSSHPLAQGVYYCIMSFGVLAAVFEISLGGIYNRLTKGDQKRNSGK